MHVGRYDLDDCLVLCEDCKYEARNELCNLIESGFWPGNVSRKTNYLFSFEVFDLFNNLHKFMPKWIYSDYRRNVSRERKGVCLYIYI